MSRQATPALAALGRRLRCAGRKMQASVEARLEAADISYSQWNALRSLEEKRECPACTLAAELGMTPASMSRIVAGLEARGLVRRQQGCGDRGAVQLTLTGAGRAMLDEAAPVVDARMDGALAGLSGPEIDTLLRLLDKLAASIDGKAGRAGA